MNRLLVKLLPSSVHNLIFRLSGWLIVEHWDDLSAVGEGRGKLAWEHYPDLRTFNFNLDDPLTTDETPRS